MASVSRIVVVVDDQSAARTIQGFFFRASKGLRRLNRLRGAQREMDDKTTPAVWPFAVDFDMPSMHFDDPPRERKADTQAPARAFDRRLQLHERFKDENGLFRGEAETTVRDGYGDMVFRHHAGKYDRCARVGILHRIA